jgi:hypothetical protein
MKRILLAVLLLNATSASAEWVQLGVNDELGSYADPQLRAERCIGSIHGRVKRRW